MFLGRMERSLIVCSLLILSDADVLQAGRLMLVIARLLLVSNDGLLLALSYFTNQDW